MISGCIQDQQQRRRSNYKLSDRCHGFESVRSRQIHLVFHLSLSLSLSLSLVVFFFSLLSSCGDAERPGQSGRGSTSRLTDSALTWAEALGAFSAAALLMYSVTPASIERIGRVTCHPLSACQSIPTLACGRGVCVCFQSQELWARRKEFIGWIEWWTNMQSGS